MPPKIFSRTLSSFMPILSLCTSWLSWVEIRHSLALLPPKLTISLGNIGLCSFPFLSSSRAPLHNSTPIGNAKLEGLLEQLCTSSGQYTVALVLFTSTIFPKYQPSAPMQLSPIHQLYVGCSNDFDGSRQDLPSVCWGQSVSRRLRSWLVSLRSRLLLLLCISDSTSTQVSRSRILASLGIERCAQILIILSQSDFWPPQSQSQLCLAQFFGATTIVFGIYPLFSSIHRHDACVHV